MALDYTTTELLARVKRTAAIPTGQPAFSDPNLLNILNDEMFETIVPWLMKFANEYFVEFSDTLITTTTESFQIPSAAIGGVLRDVKIVNKGSNSLEFEETLLSVGNVGAANRNRNTKGFFVRGDKLFLVNPAGYDGFYLRQYYFRRPNQLVSATTACRQITAIDTGTSTVSVATRPSGWTGNNLDFIQKSPPFRVLSGNKAFTGAGVDLTFSSLPDGLVVGDWLSLTGESPVPQLPYEVHPILCQSVVVKVLEALDDAQGMQIAQAKLDKAKEDLISVFSERVESEPSRWIKNDDLLDYF